MVWERTTAEDNSMIRGEQTGQWLVYSPRVKESDQLVSMSTAEAVGSPLEGVLCISGSGEKFVMRSEKAGGLMSGWMVRDRSGLALGLPIGTDWKQEADPFFSPDGNLVAWGTLNGPLVVADLDEVQRRLESLGRARR